MTATNPAVSSAVSLDDMRSRTVVTRSPSEPRSRRAGVRAQRLDMDAHSVVTHSPEETIAFGAQLALELTPPVLVLLLGELGAGKTTLAKGLVAGLGAAPEEDVTSPTFTMIHEYAGRNNVARVYHVDLYRIESARELETLGLEDLLAERAVVIVEWGEKLGPAFRPSAPGRLIEIHLQTVSESERRIEIRAAK